MPSQSKGQAETEIHGERLTRKESRRNRETGYRDKGNSREEETERDRERQKSRPRHREGQGEGRQREKRRQGWESLGLH